MGTHGTNVKSRPSYRFDASLVDNIPAELKAANRWVVWRHEQRGEKWTKVPYQSASPQLKASSTDPSTWSSFDGAVAAVAADDTLAGIGVVFDPETKLVGIDFDDCIGPDADPVRRAWAEDWMRRLGSTAAEISPSGRGLKLWYKSASGLPDRPGTEPGHTGRNSQKLGVEVYDRGRYFTVTGQACGSTLQINPVDEEALQALLAEIDGTSGRKPSRKPAGAKAVAEPAPKPKSPPTDNGRPGIVARDNSDHANLTDDALLEKIRESKQGEKFRLLYDHGDISGYPSQSEADLALMEILAFWTDGDRERMERLFGASKLGERAKWRARADYRDATISKAITCLREKRNGADDDRPVIEITADEQVVIDQAVDALTADPELFVYDFRLVRVLKRPPAPATKTRDKKDNSSPRITLLKAPMLQIRMANSARWLKQDNRRKGTKLQPAHPPPWAVNGIHCMSVWPGLRLLEGIVEAPTLRPDGTIIEQPGYDPATQYVLIPSGSFPPVPRNPGFSHAEAASRRLLDVIRQFEIQTPVHRSVWLAGLLSVVGRPAIEGYVPLFWFDGNRSSVGKTLLVDVISMIATGRCASRSTYPSGAHVNEEMRKMITALALEGTRITLLDNVTGILGCASLDNAITGSVRSDRLLGLSETTGDLSVRMVWFATCNHGKLGADLPTRSLLCRLATTYEYPEDRSDFDHPDLLGYVQANRAGLLIDALTILHAYVLAGRPSPVKPWVRFASWSDLIASAVYWVTGCNPRDVCEDIKAEDQAHEVERDLLVQLSFLLSMKPLTAAEVLTRARQTSRQGGLHTEALDHPDLWNALHALGGENVDSDWLPSPKRLGDELKKIEGRPIGGWKVVSNFDVHTKIKLWKLVRVAPVPV